MILTAVHASQKDEHFISNTVQTMLLPEHKTFKPKHLIALPVTVTRKDVPTTLKVKQSTAKPEKYAQKTKHNLLALLHGTLRRKVQFHLIR